MFKIRHFSAFFLKIVPLEIEFVFRRYNKFFELFKRFSVIDRELFKF